MLRMKIIMGTMIVSMAIAIISAIFQAASVGIFFLVVAVVAFFVMLLDFIFGDY